MSKLKVYLSGSVLKTEKSFQDWRKQCEQTVNLSSMYYEFIKIVNPISYFNYTDKPAKTEKQCLDLFMYQIERCHVLLCNLDNSKDSIGTGMEVEHAFCKGIPIIAFGKKPKTWYNWIETRASVVLDSLDEALEYINNSYGSV